MSLRSKPRVLASSKMAGSYEERMAIVLRVGALAANVEAEAFDVELVVVSEGNQVDRLGGKRAEFARELHH